jgi:hypothetical protein
MTMMMTTTMLMTMWLAAMTMLRQLSLVMCCQHTTMTMMDGNLHVALHYLYCVVDVVVSVLFCECVVLAKSQHIAFDQWCDE